MSTCSVYVLDFTREQPPLMSSPCFDCGGPDVAHVGIQLILGNGERQVRSRPRYWTPEEINSAQKSLDQL